MKEAVKRVGGRALAYTPKFLQTYIKETVELMFWRRELARSNGNFYNGHFQKFFTDLFNLKKEYFDNKKMLDVGCGPLGSLEWATGAAERVGADPLADKYQKLNKGTHSMQYVKAASEALPFADEAYDVVSMFNALDHVEDADATIREVQRVLARGGDLLLICEIDHEPTLTEPQTLKEDVLEKFDACRLVMKRIFAINADHNIYASIGQARARASGQDPGILCAHLVKN
jgi:2-polyprenyl-3-methyl-5-hydroxy-6-metoxy-1,4-benzoquinol methylase